MGVKGNLAGDPRLSNMGNQPAANEEIIDASAAPAAPEANRSNIQAAINADLAKVEGSYNPDVDYKEDLKMRNPMLDYTKMEMLGQGQFGKVYRIVHKQSGVQFAMKEINVARTNATTLQREMAVALGVNHPYLLEMEACYQHDNNLYAILPIMPRPPATPNDEPDMMSWLINKGSGCSEEEGAKITHHVAAAMKYLHDEMHTYHRDLKPDNVLVGPDGIDALKVTDYGLARFVDPNSDAGLTMGQGTAGYMAREMMQGHGDGHYDGKVDVFALGVVLYSAMVLEPPFGSQEPIRRGIPADFSAPAWRGVSRACKALCAKMLQHDPNNRCSMDEVLADPFVSQLGL